MALDYPRFNTLSLPSIPTSKPLYTNMAVIQLKARFLQVHLRVKDPKLP